MLVYILNNPRISRNSSAASSDLRRLIFVITNIIYYSRVKKRSNYLFTILDAYLIGSGIKRRVIETLAGFRLCYSYIYGNRLMRQIAEHE